MFVCVQEADGRRTRLKREKEREVYEESNFRRLTVTKQERRASRTAMTSGSLNELVNFGDSRALFSEGGDEDLGSRSSKKRKSAGGDKKHGRSRLGKKARKANKKRH